mmetsp:Transcript_28509/g.90858  ORF Transcript_28509/g.90858 Transcript_28509/m.90858 type:complete len:265 (-) Transcript_28509:2445-3239(-)
MGEMSLSLRFLAVTHCTTCSRRAGSLMPAVQRATLCHVTSRPTSSTRCSRAGSSSGFSQPRRSMIAAESALCHCDPRLGEVSAATMGSIGILRRVGSWPGTGVHTPFSDTSTSISTTSVRPMPMASSSSVPWPSNTLSLSSLDAVALLTWPFSKSLRSTEIPGRRQRIAEIGYPFRMAVGRAGTRGLWPSRPLPMGSMGAAISYSSCSREVTLALVSGVPDSTRASRTLGVPSEGGSAIGRAALAPAARRALAMSTSLCSTIAM